MPHLQPSLFQKGEDLPLFNRALEPTRCAVCGSVLVGQHCKECVAELIADPPPDDNEPWSTDHTNERS